MHSFIKVTIILLLIYFAAFSKFEIAKSFSTQTESTISLEEKEKSDNEVEDLKFVILQDKSLHLSAFNNSSFAEKTFNSNKFKPKIPTSPPNS